MRRALIAPERHDIDPLHQWFEFPRQFNRDVFTRLSGLVFHDLAADAEVLELNGREILYASKAALIRLKNSSVREKDQLDVAALKRLTEDPTAFD